MSKRVFVVDTNILIYGAETSFDEHKEARALIEDWRRGANAWYLTWPIAIEFLRVTTHPRVFKKPWKLESAWQFIEALRASPSLSIIGPEDRYASVAKETWNENKNMRGNILHDAHTANIMREHGIKKIYTRDTDFCRFQFLEVIDPLVT